MRVFEIFATKVLSGMFEKEQTSQGRCVDMSATLHQLPSVKSMCS